MNEEIIKSIFRLPPRIETERLILRAVGPGDKYDMFEYASDREVTKYLTWCPHPSLNYTKRYIESVCAAYRNGTFFDFAVELKAKRKMIGTCGFTSFDYRNNSCEVGYVLNPRYRGYSLAPEAVLAVMRFAFTTLKAHRVFARYMEGNDASRRVMEKCGMAYEGTAKGALFLDGNYVDVGCCAITSDSYFGRLRNLNFGI